MEGGVASAGGVDGGVDDCCMALLAVALGRWQCRRVCVCKIKTHEATLGAYSRSSGSSRGGLAN